MRVEVGSDLHVSGSCFSLEKHVLDEVVTEKQEFGTIMNLTPNGGWIDCSVGVASIIGHWPGERSACGLCQCESGSGASLGASSVAMSDR